MFQLIVEPVKEWLRRLARREPYAEILFRERLRAYMEIVALASAMGNDMESRNKLAESLIRNNLVMTARAVKLTNAVLFTPPASERPSIEFLKRLTDLVAHLREELRIDAIDKEELQKILRAPKKKESQDA